LKPARIRFEGSVGYYCGGLIDGAEIEISGSAGWGLAGVWTGLALFMVIRLGSVVARARSGAWAVPGAVRR